MALIELKEVCKDYCLGSRTVPVLFDVDLEIAAGEFVSIMGPSGSGKSTLMNILGCLDRPTSGKYVLGGREVDALSDHELSRVRNREIGFVFQSFHLLQENDIIANIALPLVYRGVRKKTCREAALAAATRIGLGEHVRHKPNEISGGQAQRVAIARALVGEPRLILADEPTGNLDSANGREIMDIFCHLHRQGHTILMVTHDERLARCASRIVRLGDGRIVGIEEIEGSSPPHEIKAREVAERVGKFRWLDLVKISVREGLLAHPLRTLLTVLGVLFGVAAVIAIVAINEGARRQAIDQIQQMGLNNVRVRSAKMSDEELKEARRSLSQGLNGKDLEAIAAIPTVAVATPLKQVDVEIRRDQRKPRGNVLGATVSYPRVANFYPAVGRFLSQDDLDLHRRVCVLGKNVNRELFANEPSLGKQLFLGAEIFTVVGIMTGKNEPKGVAKAVSLHDLNDNVYIPVTTAGKYFKSKPFADEYDEISIMVADSAQVQPTAALVSHMIGERHHQVEDFQLVVPEELLRQSRKTQEIFDVVMVFIAGISLVVGGIGIMNIMLANITERIQEIGIRRAVGASRRDVLKQFLVEAVIISASGGLMGIGSGWGLTLIISQYTGWQTAITVHSILLGFSVSVTVGILFGIYPAWRAALLNPITALNRA